MHIVLKMNINQTLSGACLQVTIWVYLVPGNCINRRSAIARAAMQSLDNVKSSVKEPNILIYFFFPPITQSFSVSDVLFTGGRGVSDFSVLKYY